MKVAAPNTLSATSSEVLSVQNVTQRHSRGYKYRKISLSIQKSTLNCLLGANGAGKSSLLDAISGVAVPTQGRVLGRRGDKFYNWRNLNKIVGYCTQTDSLITYLTVKELVTMFCHIVGYKRITLSKLVSTILTSFDLSQYANQTITTLSGGTKRRLHIAIIVLMKKDLIVLDEPCAGLDHQSQVYLRHLIKALHEYGNCTILYSSHRFEQNFSTNTNYIVMSKGRLVGCSSMDCNMRDACYILRIYGMIDKIATLNAENTR